MPGFADDDEAAAPDPSTEREQQAVTHPSTGSGPLQFRTHLASSWHGRRIVPRAASSSPMNERIAERPAAYPLLSPISFSVR